MTLSEAAVVAKLRERLGEQVRTEPATLAHHQRDAWSWSVWREVQGGALEAPCCVVLPRTVDDVVAVLAICREHRSPLIPYGLGSGVCGAVLTSAASVVLDLGEMARVRHVSEQDLVAEFDAGVRGSDAEAHLNRLGLTLGHYPQSIAVSTVGGWVATGSAGQFSTGYGNIEDLVLGLEVVLPSGELLQSKSLPRGLCGPDWKQLFIGSEGTLGIVTAASLSVRRLPEAQRGLAFYAPNMESGFEAQRSVLHAGWRPVVLRQYDAPEAARLFPLHFRRDKPLFLAICEGPPELVDTECGALATIAQRAGCEEAPAQIAQLWLRERNQVPDITKYLKAGLVIDTVEVTAAWSNVTRVYAAARESLAKVPGVFNGSAHSSHAYRSGINLYFTFAAKPARPELAETTYQTCLRAIFEAALDHGGSIVHHHGIGRARRAWLERETGHEPLALLRRIKTELDPLGIMNPGAVF